jgi:hypothetical protein
VKFLVTLDRDEKGWMVAECPALPGSITQGRTVDLKAIEPSLETRRAQGLPLAIDVVEVEVAVLAT